MGVLVRGTVTGVPYKIAMLLNGWVGFLGLVLLLTAASQYDDAGKEVGNLPPSTHDYFWQHGMVVFVYRGGILSRVV